ncbi:MAG TPA: hypothetical protein VGO67_19980 [Verrucomicrobiae bacterium]|jgi:hypothetical protein
MKVEMRRKLAREPFEEKIRKVGQLIQLAKKFPKKVERRVSVEASAAKPPK